MNLTQYEHLQTQKKMDKILEIFKFDKDDWVCQSGEKDEEISESLNQILIDYLSLERIYDDEY